MSQRALTFCYVAVLPMLGLAMVFLWPELIGVGVRGLLARSVLTVTGYFRPHPDPLTERALRAAFADFDMKLAEILGDRTPHSRLD